MDINSVSAVGVWFYAASTGRLLYLMRNDIKHPDCWGLPGGKIETGESLITAMERECCEELGAMPAYKKLVPIEKFTSADGVFSYHTFFCVIDEEFLPVLNNEHTGYAWLALNTWPKPMHQGLYATVNFDAVQTKIATLLETNNL